MKIRVTRDYSGKEGTDVDKNVFAGTRHTVSRARGNELFANRLVEILSDDDADADEPETDAGEPDASTVPETDEKQAPTPDNKAAPKPRTKAKA